MAQLLDQMLHLLMAQPIPQPVYAVFVAAQTAIQHQPSSQCRQASWVPPRQGRQPPSGRCALAPPPPIFFLPCVWKKACTSIDVNYVSSPKDR